MTQNLWQYLTLAQYSFLRLLRINLDTHSRWKISVDFALTFCFSPQALLVRRLPHVYLRRLGYARKHSSEGLKGKRPHSNMNEVRRISSSSSSSSQKLRGYLQVKQGGFDGSRKKILGKVSQAERASVFLPQLFPPNFLPKGRPHFGLLLHALPRRERKKGPKCFRPLANFPSLLFLWPIRQASKGQDLLSQAPHVKGPLPDTFSL